METEMYSEFNISSKVPANRRKASEIFIGSVVVPCIASDVPEGLGSILRLWASDAYCPVVHVNTHRPALIIVINNASEEIVSTAHEIVDSLPTLKNSFSSFSICDARLTGDQDIYVRNAVVAKGQFGNKAGPNFLFKKGMEYAAAYGGYALQIELDCLPLRPGWIEEVTRIADENRSGWIIGSPYLGSSGLDKRVQFHLNGNALYKVGEPSFLTFLDEIWFPRMNDLVEEMPNIAYDCWWAIERYKANAMAGNDAWRLVQSYDHFFRSAPFIVNLPVELFRVGEFLLVRDQLVAQGISPVFFHGQAMSRVATALCRDPKATPLDVVEALSAEFIAEKRDLDPPGPNTSERAVQVSFGSAEVEMASTAAAETLDLRPSISLLTGFYHVEGPYLRFGQRRIAWTADQVFEIRIDVAIGELCTLLFHLRHKQLAISFLVARGDKILSHSVRTNVEAETIELDFHPFEGLPSPGADVEICILTDAPLFLSGGHGNRRRLGLMMMEGAYRLVGSAP